MVQKTIGDGGCAHAPPLLGGGLLASGGGITNEGRAASPLARAECPGFWAGGFGRRAVAPLTGGAVRLRGPPRAGHESEVIDVIGS